MINAWEGWSELLVIFPFVSESFSFFSYFVIFEFDIDSSLSDISNSLSLFWAGLTSLIKEINLSSSSFLSIDRIYPLYTLYFSNTFLDMILDIPTTASAVASKLLFTNPSDLYIVYPPKSIFIINIFFYCHLSLVLLDLDWESNDM